MVLTEENKTDIYQATMEPGKRVFEVALFGDKVNSTANPLPAGFEEEVPFPYIFTNSNRTVSMLNGNTPGRDIGPGVILKVMAGDKIRARSFAWHYPVNSQFSQCWKGHGRAEYHKRYTSARHGSAVSHTRR